jgi:hypothetical protein
VKQGFLGRLEPPIRGGDPEVSSEIAKDQRR